MNVREWLTFVPIFVEFSQVDSFASWLRKEMQGKAIEKALDKVASVKENAWIRPDYSTRLAAVTEERNGITFEIRMEFRLRTLCVEMRCWKSGITNMSIRQAFQEMRESEEEFRRFVEKWDAGATTSNILVVEPFYDTTTGAKGWLTDHIADLDFFPRDCGCEFTASLSKLIEQEEKYPLIVTSIRDGIGVQRKVVLLCGQREAPYKPDSYFRVRWAFFIGLLTHVLERANRRTKSVRERMSQLEERVIERSHEPSKNEDISGSMEMLRSLTEFAKLLSSLENDIELVSDDVQGVERNLRFLDYTTSSEGISDEKVKDEKISGNASWISTPSLSVGFGKSTIVIDADPTMSRSSEVVKCRSRYYCILCEARGESSSLTKDPPLGMGVVDESRTLIRRLIDELNHKKSEIERSMRRVQSLVSGLTSVCSTQVNMQLSLLHSQTALDQKTILSKMENVLEESAKDRKATEDATRTVEILSLLFASFVLGEISSNFIISGMEHIWSAGAPWFAYVGGFLLAVAIACLVFSPVYFFYLRRKWRGRSK